MEKRVVFSNQKGGVGKTTLTYQVSRYLAEKGTKTLVIDMDPQANLTRSFTDEAAIGLYEALCGNGFELLDVEENLSLLLSDIRLSGLERTLVGEIDAYTRLRDLLELNTFRKFEYILIDSPPSLGVLTVNALAAVDNIVVPMNPSLYSMQGTNDLMATVSKVRKNLNPELNLLGIIINAFDCVPVITRQIREEIELSFGEKVFSTALSKSIKIEESIAERSGLVALKRAKVKDEIKAIGEEFVSRLNGC